MSNIFCRSCGFRFRFALKLKSGLFDSKLEHNVHYNKII